MEGGEKGKTSKVKTTLLKIYSFFGQVFTEPHYVPGTIVGAGDVTKNQTKFLACGKLPFYCRKKDYKPNKWAKYIAGQMKISAKKRSKKVCFGEKGESEKPSLKR